MVEEYIIVSFKGIAEGTFARERQKAIERTGQTLRLEYRKHYLDNPTSRVACRQPDWTDGFVLQPLQQTSYKDKRWIGEKLGWHATKAILMKEWESPTNPFTTKGASLAVNVS